MKPRLGLVEVGEQDLRRALRALHRGELRCPVDLPELSRCGLQHCAEPLMAALRGLEGPAVTAVLVCVLAERMERDGR